MTACNVNFRLARDTSQAFQTLTSDTGPHTLVIVHEGSLALGIALSVYPEARSAIAAKVLVPSHSCGLSPQPGRVILGALCAPPVKDTSSGIYFALSAAHASAKFDNEAS